MDILVQHLGWKTRLNPLIKMLSVLNSCHQNLSMWPAYGNDWYCGENFNYVQSRLGCFCYVCFTSRCKERNVFILTIFDCRDISLPLSFRGIEYGTGLG